MRTLAVVVVAVMLAGCGGSDGPAIGGMYQTTSHVVDSRSCGPGTASTSVPYFLLREKELFGHTYYLLSKCTAVDPASCEEYGDMLDEVSGDAWTGKIGFATGNANSCSYAFISRRAVKAGAVLTFDERSHGLQDQPDAMCDGNKAMELAATMPCVGMVTLVGQRLPSQPPVRPRT